MRPVSALMLSPAGRSVAPKVSAAPVQSSAPTCSDTTCPSVSDWSWMAATETGLPDPEPVPCADHQLPLAQEVVAVPQTWFVDDAVSASPYGAAQLDWSS